MVEEVSKETLFIKDFPHSLNQELEPLLIDASGGDAVRQFGLQNCLVSRHVDKRRLQVAFLDLG